MLKTNEYQIDNFIPSEVEKNEITNQVWALWGKNKFTGKLQLWCLPELMAYNPKEEVMATVSRLLSNA